MIRLTANPSRQAPPHLPRRAPCPQERADEADWEAQIRRMANHKVKEADPAIVSPAPPVMTALELIRGRKQRDTLLIPRTLPIAVGSDCEDLACGSCGAVIASGTSRDSARRRHPEGGRLVVRCICRALNLLYGVSDLATARSPTGPRRAVRRGQATGTDATPAGG